MRHFPLNRRRAFSLIELLVVIVVLLIMLAFVVPAVTGFGRSNALSGAGSLVTNLATLARQEAMSRNTLTALILLGDQGTEADFRALTVMGYEEGRGWAQLTTWEILPVGIVVDRTVDPTSGLGSFMRYSPSSLPLMSRASTPDDSPIRYSGKKVTSFAARVFLPNGSLMNAEEPANLRLVEGFLEGARTVYTHPAPDGKPTNYYDLALIGVSGAVKVTRPGDLL